MSNKRNNTRSPIDKVDTKNTKGKRRAIGAMVKMDMTPYEEEYPDKALMIINDIDGDLQRWLDAGAVPIPAKIKGRQVYEGLNDKGSTQWVQFSTGDGERQFNAYGLMMDKDLYYDYKIAPQKQKDADIKAAMKGGMSSAGESRSLPGSQADIGSYAPNLPIGDGQGYNEIMSK